jgi:hypothetical protein
MLQPTLGIGIEPLFDELLNHRSIPVLGIER